MFVFRVCVYYLICVAVGESYFRVFLFYCRLSSNIAISLLIFVLEDVVPRLNKVIEKVVICGIWE